MGRKIYAIVTSRSDGKRYAAHIEEWSRNVRPEFSSVEPISKTQYREARNGGMPSWGDRESSVR